MATVISRDRRERAEIVKPTLLNPKVRDYQIIDTDTHLLPDWQRLRRYMPEPYRSRIDRYPLVGADYSPVYATGKTGTGQDALGRAETAEDVLRSMEETGAHTVIMIPGFHRPQSMFHKSWVSVLASAYNDYLVEEIFPKSDRIKAVLMINQRIPEEGAAEIRRVGSHPGFVSVYTEFSGNYESIGTAQHDPIFEAALDQGLGITLHAGSFWQAFTPLHQGSRTWTELLGISSVSLCLAAVASMIMQGVFDKYPDLRVTVKEGGFWWLPEFTLRIDDFYLNHPHDVALCERKVELGESFLRRLPSEYLWDHFRFSSQPMCLPKNPRHLEMLFELCRAEDMLVFSSDWPHATFDPPNWLFDYPFITDQMRRKIFSENARAWYPRLSK